MEIPASEIKVGDFIFDFGKVTDIKYFYTDVAQEQSVDFSINDDFITSVMKEVDACYQKQKETSKVCIFAENLCRTYFSDEMVNVYRVNLNKVA